jgi:integrase/recombinase XerD
MASPADSSTLSAFLDYLRVERGSAKLTIAAYTSDLAQFAEFLEERKQNLRAARREDVREYIQELFSNGLDGRSVGRKLSAIRHLYRHLLLDGKIDKDPTLNIDLPKQWKVLPKALSRDEVGAMLAACVFPKWPMRGWKT